MTPIGRRGFIVLLGAGVTGVAGVFAGCSNSDVATSAPADGTAGMLDSMSFAVRRDPG